MFQVVYEAKGNVLELTSPDFGEGSALLDDVDRILSYDVLVHAIEAALADGRCSLVETLAERCAEIVLQEFNVDSLRLKLSKPGAVRGARAVGVVIERRRAG